MSFKKRVCVYCGSKTGNNSSFIPQTKALGHALASNKIGLVYGGGSVGLMNEIANATLSRGGQVHGVIPQHLYDMEVATKTLLPCISLIPCMNEKR